MPGAVTPPAPSAHPLSTLPVNWSNVCSVCTDPRAHRERSPVPLPIMSLATQGAAGRRTRPRVRTTPPAWPSVATMDTSLCILRDIDHVQAHGLDICPQRVTVGDAGGMPPLRADHAPPGAVPATQTQADPSPRRRANKFAPTYPLLAQNHHIAWCTAAKCKAARLLQIAVHQLPDFLPAKGLADQSPLLEISQLFQLAGDLLGAEHRRGRCRRGGGRCR